MSSIFKPLPLFSIDSCFENKLKLIIKDRHFLNHINLLKFLFLKSKNINLEKEYIEKTSILGLLNSHIFRDHIKRENLNTYKSINYSNILYFFYVSFFNKFLINKKFGIYKIPVFKKYCFEKHEDNTVKNIDFSFGEYSLFLDITDLNRINLEPVSILENEINISIKKDKSEYLISRNNNSKCVYLDESNFNVDYFDIETFTCLSVEERLLFLIILFNYNHIGLVDFSLKNITYANFYNIKRYFESKTLIVNNFIFSLSLKKNIEIKNLEYIDERLLF